MLYCFSLANLLSAATMESTDEEEVHTFIQVISEKYNLENFPYAPGMGGVVLHSPSGSPVKSESICEALHVLKTELRTKSKKTFSVYRLSLLAQCTGAGRLWNL